ncbi:MAG: amino acid ABC transporter ATP-binding protein, partial [Anaerolineales bacterium]|nr:amino acid ABC transporter ATP-binding protein [Anaerolineales bacterium]
MEGPAPTAVTDVIVCRDVHKWYGEFEALKGVNLTVNSGEVVVIIGPSGSGKSTFIRCMNRLEEHQEGRIIIDGIELSHDLRNINEIRREVGMVFQQFNLFPHMSVLENCTVSQVKVLKRSKED